MTIYKTKNLFLAMQSRIQTALARLIKVRNNMIRVKSGRQNIATQSVDTKNITKWFDELYGKTQTYLK